MKKPRSDSKLLNLPEEQQAQLADILLSGMRYHDAKKFVETEFHITTSLASLSAFWDEVCTSALITRRQQAVTTADEIAAEVQKKPGQFDSATINAIKQKAFELSISPRSAPGEVKALFSLILKARDQDLKNKDIDIKLRRLEIVEKQSASARATLADGSLSQEQREQRMKQIFGL